MSAIASGSGAPEAGYLIVKTYERMYREYTGPRDTGYSVPRDGAQADAITKRYRGIARDPVKAWTEEDLRLGLPFFGPITEPAASLHMSELEEAGASIEDFILSQADADAVFALLAHPNEWELIWACRHGDIGSRPTQSSLLGFEPSWWSGDHFSAIMDSMCFPRWHGHDREGTALAQFHEQLNGNALFDAQAQAAEFLAFYCSQEWAEKEEMGVPYVIVEVRLIER